MISYDVKVFNKLECVILTTVPFTYIKVIKYIARISGSIDLSPQKMGETYVATGITGRVEIQIVSLINQFHDIYIIVILNRFEREHTSQAIVLHKFSHLAFSCELVD